MSATFSIHSFFPLSRKSSPFRPKEKFAKPPGTRTFPKSTPPGLHTLSPSPQAAYTLPAMSHLSPSGTPTSAMAKTRRFIRNLDCARSPTSYAYLATVSCGLTAQSVCNSHSTCPLEIYMPVSVDKLCITNIAGPLFRAEANSTWSSKPIGYDSDITRVRIKAIHLAW